MNGLTGNSGIPPAVVCDVLEVVVAETAVEVLAVDVEVVLGLVEMEVLEDVNNVDVVDVSWVATEVLVVEERVDVSVDDDDWTVVVVVAGCDGPLIQYVYPSSEEK